MYHLATMIVRALNIILLCLMLVAAAVWVWQYDNINRVASLWHIDPAAAKCVDRPFDFTVEDLFGRTYSGNTSSFVDRHILCYGIYEYPVLSFMRDAVATLQRSRNVYIDVGAYAGTHVMFMSEFVDEVHAFEPAVETRQRLERHLQINDIQNVFVHAEGLSDKTTVSPFFADRNTGQVRSSFIDDFVPNLVPSDELQLVRGDDKLQALQVDDITIIKIDVEGLEKPVLLGLGQALNKFRPIVVFELSYRGAERFESSKELNSVLPEGYQLFAFTEHYSPSGDYDLKPFSFHFEPGTQEQIVAIPEEVADLLSL